MQKASTGLPLEAMHTQCTVEFINGPASVSRDEMCIPEERSG